MLIRLRRDFFYHRLKKIYSQINTDLFINTSKNLWLKSLAAGNKKGDSP